MKQINYLKFIGIIFFFISINATAQEPAGYYDGTDGLTGTALKLELRGIIDGHTTISYTGLWTAYKTTDKRADGKVWDIYTDNCDFTLGSDQCGSYSSICDCYNREHTVPQSWFGSSSPMVSDIFHVLPTDGKVNGYRGNLPFGECASGTTYGNSRLGSCTYPGYSGTVFEPADEYKGDIARIYFYMATRYSGSTFNGESFSGDDLSAWTKAMLLEWHSIDPVSDKEIDRNNEIYDNYQHNRNPYVDHPEWAECVFNNVCTGTVANPTNFTATGITSSQINLAWVLNAAGDDIVLAYSTSSTFGTPTGTYTAGASISGGGTVLAVGNSTSFNHTSLSDQTYYYKIWSIDGDGNYSTGVTASSKPLTPEPTNHVTNFTVTSTSPTTVTLTWTDATGTTLPAAYLIKCSTTSSIAAPVDGTAQTNSTFIKNVNQGVRTVTFTGLANLTQYFFEIYPYTNSGSTIDYKTDGTIPTANGTTLEYTGPTVYISELAGKGQNEDYNNEYIEIVNMGADAVSLANYTLEYYEGTSAEATLSLTGSIPGGGAYVIAVRTSYTSGISPDLVPSASFSINNPYYVILKENGTIIDQAGTSTDKFTDDLNYEFTVCTGDNEPTANWESHGVSNGTPGVNPCASIDVLNIAKNTITIYPNPASSQFITIENSDKDAVGAVKVYDLNGKLLYSNLQDSQSKQIDISNFAKGLFIVEINTPAGIIRKKVIKL